MSTEIVSDLDEAEPEAPIVLKPKDKPKEKPKDDSERDAAGERLGSAMRAVKESEESSLKELLDSIGPAGSFRVRLSRRTPEESRDVVTGKMVKVGGFLKNYDDVVDENAVQSAHGGGTFEFRILRRNTKGQYQYYTQRTITIAGDPNLDDPCLNRVHPPASGVAPASSSSGSPAESPTLAAKAFDVLTGQLTALREDRDHDRHDGRGAEATHPAVMQMMAMVQTQLESSQRELAEMRRAAVVKPPEDPFKTELLSNLMREDNARIASIRAQFESEVRMLKENAHSDIKRLEDRHERYQSEMRQSHEREIANLRQSHEVTGQAIRASFETQAKLLEMEVRRLERDNGELRVEAKELRAKHGKGIVEQAKELNAVKEALGIGDDSDESTVDKLLGFASSPGAAELAQRVIGGVRGAQPAQAPPQAVVETRPRIVATPDGKRFRQMPTGQLIPLKEKKKVIATTNPDGTPGPELPAIPAETSALVIGFLERAFAAGTDPVLVAQSYRAQVPDDIMSVIRQHGVDLYLTKVAKLPGGSPLSNQAGKNWVRRVGEALVE